MTTRRTLLGVAAGAPFLDVAASQTPPDAERSSAHLSGDRLFADVKYFTDLGEHRTATDVDATTADWLHFQLSEAGFKARFQSFPAQRVDVRESRVEIDGRRVPVFPLWPVRWPDARPLTGPLRNGVFGDPAEAGAIAVVRTPATPGGVITPDFDALVRSTLAQRPRALIIITENKTDDLVALNASPRIAPWPCPVLLAAPRDGTAFESAATLGKSATLHLDGATLPGTARNVIGVRGESGPTIVVTTPMSGWFRCAGERGPGIALFLAMAREVAQANLPGRWFFAANSGHELGYAGGEQLVKHEAPSVADVKLWLHFGAGVATYAWKREADVLMRIGGGPDPARVVAASTEARRAQLAALLAGQAGFERPFTLARENAAGEAGIWTREGYADVVTLVAPHTFHHMPGDGPECTGPELLEPVARACATLLRNA